MNKYDKALLPGTVLRGKKNSYRIDRVLGQGTFGITYLAYTTVTVEGDLGKLQTEIQVAVKEFFMSDINGREGSSVTTGGSGELFERYQHKFSREASNLAKLKYRGIVKVIETFEANGTSYYAMEYCGGGSLDALIAKRGGLPQGEALRYFGQIAEALSYMHLQRMLHLDLKPGNVMLRTDGEAVLIDFGLSKQFNDKGEPESSTTIGGGTPGYAPIEQANYREDSGGKLPVTMDVYALGGTLYKMLTGERPPVASDVLIEFPEQPLRTHGVSDNVIAAIRRAMEAKPHDRYQTVAAFAAALDCASEATEAADQGEEPEVMLVDAGRQPVAKQQHTPAAEPAHAHQEQQQNEYPEPEQPRRKWLPWVVGLAVAAVAFVAVMLLQRGDEPQPSIEVPEGLITAVASDTVSADEQPVQQVAQQPQKPEPQRQQRPQRPVQQEPVEQPQPTRPEPQQPQRPVQQEPVEQPQPTRPEPQQPVQQPEPEPEPTPEPVRPQHNLPDIAMVYVSGGTFTMGATSEQGGDAASYEKPAHSVTLSGYYIGKYEVTQELWKAVMGSNPSYYKGDNLPVEQVNWNDVQEFLRKLNAMTGKRYRLPTEAEWEFAARGGNSSRGYKYSGSNSIGNVAWYWDDSGTHAVGTKSPNELGIYDMSGNVYEWCQDWYSSSYYGSSPRTNPKGPNSGSNRVRRGGSWGHDAGRCRVLSRSGYSPVHRDNSLGFRLAL